MSNFKTKDLKSTFIGTRTFKGLVDITDPCYSKDTWCRINDVHIKPGEYSCRVWRSQHKYERYDGKKYIDTRVMVIGIYFNDIIPEESDMKKIGTIGVDAGLAGFFEDKPDYSPDEWSEFCKRTFNPPNKDAWIFPEGFFSSSGYGDGEYSVFSYTNSDNEITALEIRF